MNFFKKLLLVTGISLCMFATPAFANTTQMYKDDTLISLNQEILVNDNVFVPLREVCENLGYTVSWNGDSYLIRLQKNFYDVLIDLKNNEAFVCNDKTPKKISTEIIDGRTYVSVEELNNIVRDIMLWNKDKNSLMIETNESSFTNCYFHEINSIDYFDYNSDTSSYKTIIYIPQIQNIKRLQSISKINTFFRNIGYEYVSNLNPDSNDTLTVSFDTGYNRNDIISLHLTEIKNNVLTNRYCYTFNLLTGEQLKITDIMKGTNDDIVDTLVNLISTKISNDDSLYWNGTNSNIFRIFISNFKWYIKDENIIFYFDNLPGKTNITEYKLDMRSNPHLFKINLCNFNDSIEESFVKQYANDFYLLNNNNYELTLVDKTCLDFQPFYVFKINPYPNRYLLVSIDCQDFYICHIKNNLYASHYKTTNSAIRDIDMYEASRFKNDNLDNDFWEITDYRKDSHGNTLMELCKYDLTKVDYKKYIFNKKTDDLSELSKDIICPICVKDIHAYPFVLPYININSSDAHITNNTIGKILEYSSIYNLWYDQYINDNILSINIVTNFDNNFIYNFDISTGNRLSNIELLQRKNLSKEEFLDKLYNRIKDIFLVENKIVQEEVDYYLDKYKQELLLNCSTILPMYLNENNDLIVHTKIPSIDTNSNSMSKIFPPIINLDEPYKVNLPTRCKYAGNYKLTMPCEFLKSLAPNGIIDSATLSINSNGFGYWDFKYDKINLKFTTAVNDEDDTKLCTVSRSYHSDYENNLDRYNSDFLSFFNFSCDLNVTLKGNHLLVSNDTYTLDLVKE